MTAYGAVEPGTDLSVRARELQRVHDAVLAGSRPDARPRPVVARSWSRVLALGLDPDRANLRDPLPADDVERRRRASPLALVVDELRRVLTSVADASVFLVVVCDADGVILWREGSARVRLQADHLGFAEGATWTEQRVGTNAIGTALAEAAPVQLFSAEHFERQQVPWYCTAHPLHDPRTGELLGVVDVSGPALTLHPALGSLVESAVRLAEGALHRHHRDGLDRLRREAAPLVGSGPLLVVDDHGWVAHHEGLAARDRIEAPSPDRPVAVPGLGLCVPERLGRGWLVRPSGGAVRVTARLHPDGVLDVVAGDRSWRATLTRRHAQILTHLAGAGPRGLDACALSVLVHGDAEHVVTARAEVSRLRRAVGALVATGPYRLADGVRLEVVGDVP
ncbi:GAF domain-containing protein [Nocardioides dongxiaopingii]|uniref:GAF domain-containing protein n=1 Tax=Nocardioides sp. S-1144 TaxID=2582905 RepID=UPI00110F6774|nr:GAF domain-containing protein [Nocardioides sp. S-1144]QCW50350.1 GAF domain-containing protein [Nocardioides sp. S-1144]